jgi:GxxExxY protein
VTYGEIPISGQRIDLTVGGLVIVELKAVARFEEIHRAQLISYLRASGLRGGLLINFRVRVLKDGIRRIVLT